MVSRTEPQVVVMPAEETSSLCTRWIIQRDWNEVLQAEQDSFGKLAWTEEDFRRCLRQRNCIGMVVERGVSVVGFMIYERHAKKLNILKFAVAPAERRAGAGAKMVARLVSKLGSRRNRITVIVPADEEGGARDFFLSQGFVRLHSLPDYYPHRGSGKDALLLRYVLPGAIVSDDADWDVCSLPVEVLSMQVQHLDAVVAIDREIPGEHGWTQADFLQCIAEPGCTGWVATCGQSEEEEKRVVGFMICHSLADGTQQVSNMAVAFQVRHQGVGEMLITHLRSQKSTRVVIDVSTSSSGALDFLLAQGYQITRE